MAKRVVIASQAALIIQRWALPHIRTHNRTLVIRIIMTTLWLHVITVLDYMLTCNCMCLSCSCMCLSCSGLDPTVLECVLAAS